MKKHNQNGFAVFEGILILVIVVFLVAVGWFVWDKHNQSKKPDANSSSASSTQSTTSKPVDTQKYLTIKEWGVKIPVSGAIADAKYDFQSVATNSGTDATNVATPTVIVGGETCRLLGIYRLKYGQSYTNFQATYKAGTDNDAFVKVGDYYYYIIKPTGATCALDQNGGEVSQAIDAKEAITSAFKQLQTE